MMALLCWLVASLDHYRVAIGDSSACEEDVHRKGFSNSTNHVLSTSALADLQKLLPERDAAALGRAAWATNLSGLEAGGRRVRRGAGLLAR